MSHLPVRATVLCGAGVSMESGLPDGQTLAAMAFQHVAQGNLVYPTSAIDAVLAELGRPLSKGPLRLELVLDLMAREVKASTLAGVYTVTQGATPSRAHHILAQLDVPVVTTNQDVLIEDAAKPSRVELSGAAGYVKAGLYGSGGCTVWFPLPLVLAAAALASSVLSWRLSRVDGEDR